MEGSCFRSNVWFTAKHTVGFLKNFDAKIGAFASTWNFHENNMIVIGSNEKDMVKAANSLVTTQGGLVDS